MSAALFPTRRAMLQGAMGCTLSAITGLALAADPQDNGCIRNAGPGTINPHTDEDIWDGYSLIKGRSEYAGLGLALDRMTRFFGARASFGFVDDTAKPNAGASPSSTFPGVQGSILMGTSMFRNSTERYTNGQFITLLVTAHEFGHIVQFGSPVEAQFKARGPGPAATRVRELHADFLAGFYFAELRRINLDVISGQAAARIMHDLGDVRIAPDHGRPDERVAVANAGYETGWTGGYTIAGAIQYGADLVLGRY